MLECCCSAQGKSAILSPGQFSSQSVLSQRRKGYFWLHQQPHNPSLGIAKPRAWLTCRCYNSRKHINSALKSVQWKARLLETSFSVCEAHHLSLPSDDSVMVWGCTLCGLTNQRGCLLSQTLCPSTFHWTYSRWLMSISPPWHFELQAIGIVVWLNHILKVFLKTCVTKSFRGSRKQEFFRSHSRLTIMLGSYRRFGMEEDIPSLFPSVCCWFFFLNKFSCA